MSHLVDKVTTTRRRLLLMKLAPCGQRKLWHEIPDNVFFLPWFLRAKQNGRATSFLISHIMDITITTISHSGRYLSVTINQSPLDVVSWMMRQSVPSALIKKGKLFPKRESLVATPLLSITFAWRSLIAKLSQIELSLLGVFIKWMVICKPLLKIHRLNGRKIEIWS